MNSGEISYGRESIDQCTTDKYTEADQVRNANSQTIFGNVTLTCQFLKEYTELPIFADLKPEDIEDVSERYRAFLGVEFETDTVKKVRVKIKGEDKEVFVIPLIEHKSAVDYDIAMQLLRYMAVIWYDYKKQQDHLVEDISTRKGFRYPPIIPIVYYEGTQNWTADMHLLDRIECGEQLKEYVPDFTYRIVRVHDYSNTELEKMDDEMSLVMMINKIQTAKDYEEFIHTSRDYVNRTYAKAPEDIKKVIREVLWSLLIKMNMPVAEAQERMNDLKEGGMGYLFENMEKMDIQAERRNTQIARQEAEEARQEAEKAKQEAERARQKVEEAAEKVKKLLDNLISRSKNEQITGETITELQKKYGILEEDIV